jgi:hypothetical protein
MDQGMAYVAAGLPEEATKLFTTATTMEHNQSEIAKAELTLATRNADWVTQMASKHPHTPEGWKDLQTEYTMTFGKPSPFADKPYTDKIWDSMSAASQTLLQKAQSAAAQARADRDRAGVGQAQSAEELNRIRTRAAERKEAAMKKAGLIIPEPKPAQVKEAADLVHSMIGSPNDPTVTPTERALGLEIATDALDIQRKERTTVADALRKSYAKNKERIKAEGMHENNKVLGTMNHPIGLPPKLTPEYTKSLVEGKYYEIQTGPNKGFIGSWNPKTQSLDPAPLFRPAEGDDGGDAEQDANTDDEPALEAQ